MQTKSEYPTSRAIIDIAQSICEVIDVYRHRGKYTEKHVELLLCQQLCQRYSHVRSQKKAQLAPKANAKKPNQIDFEIGTTNRVSIEFAVRRVIQNQASGHQPSQNRSELLKLTNETVARTRYLLIIDISGCAPVSTSTFQNAYRTYKATDFGAFRVKPVNVLYVHSHHQRGRAVRVLM